MIKIRVFYIIATMCICMITMIGCNEMVTDNSTNKNELLTKKYSISQIEELKTKAQTEQINYSKFRRDFDAQCVRKTHQGYYVVLLLQDNSNAFVFFDEDDCIFEVLLSSGFKTKDEFDIQLVKDKTKNEMLKYDPNAILTPVSAVEITAHIVQEGICIVKYTRFSEKEALTEPTVVSISFFSNEDIQNSEDSFIKYEIPYILEIDKNHD